MKIKLSLILCGALFVSSAAQAGITSDLTRKESETLYKLLENVKKDDKTVFSDFLENKAAKIFSNRQYSFDEIIKISDSANTIIKKLDPEAIELKLEDIKNDLKRDAYLFSGGVSLGVQGSYFIKRGGESLTIDLNTRQI